MKGGGIVVLVSGFPRRSETFALNELAALESCGALAAVFATKEGDPETPQPGVERLAPLVRHLAPGTPEEQAAEVAHRIGSRRVSGIHAYFAHTPAEVAHHAARRLAVPFGFSAHARDLRKAGRERLSALGRGAACVVACNADAAATLRGAGVEPEVVPHGVDLHRFPRRPAPAAGPLQLLAVGRLVPKKGFDVLLRAMGLLRADARLRIVGEGPERGRLEGLTLALGLTERVTFAGALTHTALPAIYAESQVVVVPSIADTTGDRDGLPNVVLEAMATGRPVVASTIGALASAVVPAETGVLVPPGDPQALAVALEILAARPQLRAQLGLNARGLVERYYDLHGCTARLTRVLGAAYA